MDTMDASGEGISSEKAVILFYKYHPLSNDESTVEIFRLALENLCRSLNLKGRILVGCSKHRSEGINGTLSGNRENLRIFVKAFTDANKAGSIAMPSPRNKSLAQFHVDCREFYEKAKCPVLEMKETEFKWSLITDDDIGQSSDDTNDLFPDLNIKIVRELIGTGGVLSSIPIHDLHQGYLTPKEWHQRISELNDNTSVKNDTILIDCRNTKECAIGNFAGALDPQTTTFNQFPKWVDDHKHKLRNKKVLMYCTGGIRCEKASAYVRQAMGSSVQEVRHLQGGIHKYLEEFGGNTDDAENSSMWRGKNFVFDGRGAHGPSTISEDMASNDTNNGIRYTNNNTVGACRYCNAPYDSFDPHCVCTVCKEPILVCKQCQNRPIQNEQKESSHNAATRNKAWPQHHQNRREYHCTAHKHLEDCYFTNLEGFSAEELLWQLAKLEAMAKEIAVGKKFKQRRKTLMKQRTKIQVRLDEFGSTMKDSTMPIGATIELKCRNCGQVNCSGKCWGFHGLKRKRILEGEEKMLPKQGGTKASHNSGPSSDSNFHNARLKEQKELQKRKQIESWVASGLTLGPEVGRDPSTGLRVPKPCIRVLETNTKGKWCGMPLLKVLRTEFPSSLSNTECSQADSEESDIDEHLQSLLEKELIRVNRNPIRSLDEANNYKLKNMDVIDRIVYWQEPPIHLPNESIGVQKIAIPDEYLNSSWTSAQSAIDESVGDKCLYVCNKPSTVPVHPAGPYLSNSLTLLVEAQMGLSPKTLIPCHRIDRVTSGMTLCCADPRVARLVQTTISSSSGPTSVQKEYLAKVIGRFPSSETEANNFPIEPQSDGNLAHWKWTFHGESEGTHLSCVQIDAPIETVDPVNGIRKITSNGKASSSRFRLLDYDAENDTSILSCIPITGRSHQLRVHLEYLGHPIVDDIQYGGRTDSSGTAIDPSAGVQCVLQNQQAQNGDETPQDSNVEGITLEQAFAAREVGASLDPSKTFSFAQLLQGGHAICLHAYRYSLTLQPGNRSTRIHSEAKDFRLKLGVELPPWASHLKNKM